MSKQTAWTAAEVRRILSNPVYVGMGSFPCLIADELWIAAQARRVQEGVPSLLRSLRQALHESLGYSVPRLAASTWLDESCQAIARDGLESFLHALLADLRADLNVPPAQAPGP